MKFTLTLWFEDDIIAPEVTDPNQ